MIPMPDYYSGTIEDRHERNAHEYGSPAQQADGTTYGEQSLWDCGRSATGLALLFGLDKSWKKKDYTGLFLLAHRVRTEASKKQDVREQV